MFADHHIMSHVDQVIGFNPGLDPGLAQGRPVNGIIGPDFAVIINLDNACLRNLDMDHPVRAKPTRHYRSPSRRDDNTLSDDCSRKNGNVGINNGTLPIRTESPK